MKKGMIPERMHALGKVDFSVEDHIKEMVRAEDLRRWANKPNEVVLPKQIDIPERSEPLGFAIWNLINACIP